MMFGLALMLPARFSQAPKTTCLMAAFLSRVLLGWSYLVLAPASAPRTTKTTIWESRRPDGISVQANHNPCAGAAR